MILTVKFKANYKCTTNFQTKLDEAILQNIKKIFFVFMHVLRLCSFISKNFLILSKIKNL